jgi:anaerobic magnesium-protoporphyrin IX monomethyl ester cyclase
MVDVLFTHSYFLKFDPKEYRAMMPYPPLGTLYAASYLESKGYTVALFDAMLAESEQEIISHLKIHHPKFVVIYDDDFNYLTKMCLSRMRRAAFTMSKLAKEFGCTVIVHGSDPADHAEDYLQQGADFVIFGEGEITLAELLDGLTSSSSHTVYSLRGIAFQNNGSVQRNERRDVLQNLDHLPFPSRKLINIEQYRTAWMKHHGYFSMNIVTTRGCPFHCNWCAKPIYGQVYHSRSPENVVDEMLLLKKNYQPNHLWFCDDIFGLKPGWVPSFADVVVKHNAHIPYKCLSRADLLLKENTVYHLARSGCQSVWIGAESGSQKILDAMEKGTKVEQIYYATKLLHEKGIRVGFFLQYGYPGETCDDIELTLTMVKECKPDEIGISVSYPLPGTKFYENVKQQLGEKQNWIDSQDLDLMFAGTYAPDFYRALHKITHKKFRIWQGVDIFKETLAHPWKINTRTLRRIVATAYHAATLPSLKMKLEKLSSVRSKVYS